MPMVRGPNRPRFICVGQGSSKRRAATADCPRESLPHRWEHDMDATTQRTTTFRNDRREHTAPARDEVCVVVMPHGPQPVSEGEANCRAVPVGTTQFTVIVLFDASTSTTLPWMRRGRP